MTFAFEKERMMAMDNNGTPMGYITFPQIRTDLVNIQYVTVYSQFRGQGVEDSMMEALLAHLTGKGQKAVLSSPYVQRYVREHEQWKHILPGKIHVTSH